MSSFQGQKLLNWHFQAIFIANFFGQTGENKTFHKKLEANGFELELLNWNYPKLFNHEKYIAAK